MTGLASVLDAKQLERNWDAPWHQAYLRWYDRVGPKVAAFIQERPILKVLVRAVAAPVAHLSAWWLARQQTTGIPPE